MAQRTVVASAETIARENHALELKRAGASYTAIGEQLGIDRSNAHKIVKRALGRVHLEPALEIRKLEAERLDRLQLSQWQRALNGDGRALDRVLRIMERRAKLLGLDHEHGVAERHLQLEADKVRMMALAFGRALDSLDPPLTDGQRQQMTAVFLGELRAADEATDHDDEDS